MSVRKHLRVAGVVLTGGRSERFGSNKALFTLNKIPMARVVADIMVEAGIDDIIVVGDSPVTADAIGLRFLNDEYPGEGPLGGLISAMRGIDADVFCVLACDVPCVPVSRIRQLLTAVVDFPHNDVAVLMTLREHWLCSAWRVKTCLPILIQSVDDGERAIHRALGKLVVIRIAATERELKNVNTLQDGLELRRTYTLDD